MPYSADDNLGVGAVYQIPKDEFENVIMTYFNIDSETLQSKTVYDSKDKTYEYKPRGYYETEYPEYPYSEVVGFTENSDGTITLTVNVVFPYEGDSKVYSHEVTVRPLDHGGVQYVSNRIILSDENHEKTWHIPRLTEEEWEKIYDSNESGSAGEEAAAQSEKGYDLSIDETERDEAESDCKIIMGLISDLYDRADKGEASNVDLDNETIYEMRDRIKENGYPVKTMETYSNMENYEKVDKFLVDCEEGKSGSAVVCELHSDGGIERDKYIFDGKNMYVISASATWSRKDARELFYISRTRIKEWNYTDRGWFCYELCVPEPPEVTEVVDGSCLVRIKPLTEEQREMSEKCLQGPGYRGNNLLRSDWDFDHMEKLDYNGMYEYLYAMKNQKAFDPGDYPNGIPREMFESLMMEYLPVTADQIREYAVYDEKSGDDVALIHELTVKFGNDGSFQYLGNKILKEGVKNISEYQYRVPKDSF